MAAIATILTEIVHGEDQTADVIGRNYLFSAAEKNKVFLFFFAEGEKDTFFDNPLSCFFFEAFFSKSCFLVQFF